MRIDSHVHVWTLGETPFPHSDQMSTARPEYPGLLEDLIRYMDLNDIDRTVLIQCMYHGYDNKRAWKKTRPKGIMRARRSTM